MWGASTWNEWLVESKELVSEVEVFLLAEYVALNFKLHLKGIH